MRKFVKEHVKEDHTIIKRSETKRNRADKFIKKRITNSEHLEVDEIGKLIQTLDFTPESLERLAKLLSYNQIDKYFAPCSQLYPDYKGPYIFPNDKPLQWLYNLLDHKDVHVLFNATKCLIGISGHEKQGEWVNRLIIFLPKLYKVLEYGPSQLKENVLFILANMCADSSSTRDLIIKDVIPTVCNIFNMESWTTIACCSIFMRSLFSHEEKLPAPQFVMPLWNILVNRVLIEHFNLPMTYMPSIAEDIMRCIDVLIKFDDQYKLVIIQNVPLFDRMFRYATDADGLVQFFASRILTRITTFKPTHIHMVKHIDTFVKMMNFSNDYINVRIEAAEAVANLAESSTSLPFICSAQMYNTIQMQFEYNSEVSPLINHMYYLINSIVITSKNANMQNVVFPVIMEKFMHRICQSLFLEHQEALISRSLQSLKYFAQWDFQQTKFLVDKYDGLSRLDSLAANTNIEIQIVAEELKDILEGCSIIDEDNC